MAETTTHHVEEFEYQAEMKQLLHLIIHSLYTHPEIFLRELISNASDALNKARFRRLTDADVLTSDADLKINLHLDADQHTLSVEDTGIGMTHDDLIGRIGTIASSGTLEFLQQLKQADKPVDAQLIGQFGVGFYSSFMVADEVTIETRHADPDSKGYRWTSDGAGRFTIEEIDREARGTKITLHLKDDAKDFAQTYRVKHIIQKYSNFVDFPIFVGDEQVNTVKALWHKHKDEVTDEERSEFYKFIANDFQDPLGHLHLHIEGRVNFDALLFIPATVPPGLFREDYEQRLHLYSNNVFIQDDCKALLPDYLRFIRGVVDTEDLPLNVSREVTQASPVMTKINTILAGKILGLLSGWATQDPEKYDAFFKQFGSLFKTGITTEYGKRDQILDLLRYESTKTEPGRTTSLKDYVGRMKPDQEALYYLMGPHRDAVERNPNLEYFRKNDLEVLLLVDPVDVFTFPYIHTYDEKPLTSIEKADLDLKQDEASQQEALAEGEVDQLLALFKTTLGEKVEDVVASKRLVDSAATLVVGEKGLDTQMEHMMKLMNQDFAGSSKILEVNTAHPLLKNLARLQHEGGSNDLLEKAILQLYEAALLIDGNLNQATSFVERMTEWMVKATAKPQSENDS
ncbi:MAG: molecular chaperone HtpG [Rhodothermales bacterium]